MAEPKEKVMHTTDHDLQSYTENLANSLNNFRKQQIFCDVVLVVEGKKFQAHKNVLASSSPYFNKVFNQPAKKKKKEKDLVLVVNDVSLKVMEHLLEYLYTGVVDLSVNNVSGLIMAANILLLPRLKSMGCKFLSNSLNLENCINIFSFADRNDCVELKKVAQLYINKDFKSVCKTESFLKLSLKQIEEIVSNDDIVVDREEEVYEAILAWVKHEGKSRNSYFSCLFRHVRLASMSKYYLHTNIGSEELVKTNRQCIELLLDAMKYLSLMQAGHQGTPTIGPRKCLKKQVDAVITCGGLYEGNEKSSCLCFVPSEEAWFSLAPITAEKSRRRWAHGMAEVEGFVYVVGGFYDDSKQDATSNVCRYDFRTNTWVEVSALRQCTSLPAVTVHDGQLYVIGGTDNDALRDTQRYSPETNTWESLARLSVGRCAACAAADDHHVYVFGGMQESSDFLDTAEKYEPSANTWIPIESMSTVRAFACVAAVGEKIYVIGGSTDVLGKDALSSCEVYDTRAQEWRMIASMGIPRFAATTTVIHERLYVLGGGQASETFSSVESYSVVNDEWKKDIDMPRASAHLQCCAVQIPKDLLRTTPRLY
ncbi:kelch-like protein 17 [Actinia tenebrosa]|uniref:Kelch-like protein 17 n=1 Tax=Actinia tenebrosa TaxID=6105 RepID=A0A6P8HB85_ACTTE|nr:kelch-like protein 17 [Actinia tenebrosa]